MIIFSHDILPQLYNDKVAVFNFSSFKEGYERLTQLNPVGYGHPISNSYDFDMWYYNYVIWHNQKAFKELVDIMRFPYNGADVILLVDNRIEYSEILVETLSKLISERYGYQCDYLNTPEDIETLCVNSDFSKEGLLVFDQDVRNYFKLFTPKDVPQSFYNMFLR